MNFNVLNEWQFLPTLALISQQCFGNATKLLMCCDCVNYI